MNENVNQSIEENYHAYQLYSQKAIGIATALGSIIAGVFLIASNLKKLERSEEVLQTYIFGIVIFALILISLIKIPMADNAPGVVIQIIQVGIIYLFANNKIGKDLKLHEEKKGSFYSNWRTVGISLLLLPLVVGALIGVNILGETKVDFGNDQYVYYEYDANEDNAKALGNYLLKVGFFRNDTPIDVTIGKIDGDIYVKFVLADGYWLKPDIIDFFETVRQDLIRYIFKGNNVNIILCDDFYRPKKTISG